jgi:hypothetical protein
MANNEQPVPAAGGKTALSTMQALTMIRQSGMNSTGQPGQAVNPVSEAARTLGQQSAQARAQRAAAQAEAPAVEGEPETEPQTDAEPAEQQDASAQTDAEAAPETEAQPTEGGNDAATPLTITIDGTELTAEEIKRGYLRRADHSRAMNRLGEEKRAFDAERSQKLTMLDSLVAQLRTALPPAPDPEMRRTDPIGYFQAKEEHAERSAKLAQAEAVQRAEAERGRLAAKKAMFDALPERIPEWNDTAKLQKGLELVVEHMGDLGVSEATLAALSDPAVILAFENSRKWLNLEKSKAGNQKRVANAPKVVRPAGRVNPQGVAQTNMGRAQTAFNDKPTVQSAIALMQARRAAQGGPRSTVA